VTVDAGYLMPRLAAETAKAGRAGLEFAAGVPGAVGGSVVGNAGAFGTEVKDRLISAQVIDERATPRTVPAADCAFAYRESVFKHERRRWIVLAATFRTTSEPPVAVRARLLEVQKHRRATQPIEQRSLGSTFKNPPGDSAGRLIDAAGLKGLRIGGALISPKHANFIVNLGGASADDVLALMAEMRNRVFQRFGIELEPEVRIIGRALPA
jgi:UDP-N-acetylmuramate dehydrogenase